MSKFARILAAVLVAFAALPLTSALATQQSAAEFQRYVSEGKFAEGARALGAIASSDANDTEAQFGAGALQFLTAIKNLQGGLYHYGAGNELARQLNKWMRNVVPILRLPVPANPAPEVADYQVVRGILERFVDDLSLSAALLEKVGSRPVKLPFDPFKVAVDFNNDGRIAEQETMLGALMSIGRGSRVEKLPDATINFDTADVTWLQGYANALMGMGNLLLAFDFEETALDHLSETDRALFLATVKSILEKFQ
ncbi:MAG: hypothetical protein GY761_15290 [Hyphomicrobiales bacterium]|nr:hypothetical protein [Hyphomicrobiales bacterium]